MTVVLEVCCMHDGDVQYDLREISSSAKKYSDVATNIVLELMHNSGIGAQQPQHIKTIPATYHLFL